MSPSSLLNVSPDLMRERARHGPPCGPAAVDDRTWIIGVSLALTFVATLLILAVR